MCLSVKVKHTSWLNSFLSPLLSQDAPVQTHVREALSRPRLAHVLRPSHGSSNRIIGDLRNAKWSTRREERYRILSSHRAGLPPEPRNEREPEENAQTDEEPRLRDVQVFDIVQEDVEEDEKDPEQVRRVVIGTCLVSVRGAVRRRKP